MRLSRGPTAEVKQAALQARERLHGHRGRRGSVQAIAGFLAASEVLASIRAKTRKRGDWEEVCAIGWKGCSRGSPAASRRRRERARHERCRLRRLRRLQRRPRP